MAFSAPAADGGSDALSVERPARAGPAATTAAGDSSGSVSSSAVRISSFAPSSSRAEISSRAEVSVSSSADSGASAPAASRASGDGSDGSAGSSSARTLPTISRGSNGLISTSWRPIASQRDASSGSNAPVSRTTGMRARPGSRRTNDATS